MHIFCFWCPSLPFLSKTCLSTSLPICDLKWCFWYVSSHPPSCRRAFITIFLAAWIQIRLHYGISSPGCTRKWGMIFRLPACHKWLLFELILPSSSFQTTLKPSCLIPHRKESSFIPLRTNQALGSLSITRDSYLPLAVTELWLGACVSS